jgi:HEPN domain-containing protein
MKKNNNIYQAQRWMKQAEDDFDVAKWDYKGGFWSQVCFMSQQAAEKSLKAFLYAKGFRNIVSHSLLFLAQHCKNYDLEFKEIIKNCKKLDKYYIITRYPNGLPDLIPADYFDQEESKKALLYCKQIIKFVKKRLII